MTSLPLVTVPEELAGRSPEEVLAFLRTATDDEVREAVHGIGTPVVLDLLFTAMARRYAPQPGRAPGRLAFVLDDDGAEQRHVLELDPDGAQVAGASGRDRATLRTTVVRFLRVAAGAADPKLLVLTGRLRISGDLVWAVTTLTGMSAPA